MRRKFFPFLLLVFALPACFLGKEYKSSKFTYTQDGRAFGLPLVVPKGYEKEEKIDTAGITVHSFRFANGAFLYAAFLTDTNLQLQPFNETLHQPLRGPQNGRVYKGQDEKELFYREIRRGALRFGYRNVPEEDELKFDSATNFAAKQIPAGLRSTAGAR